MGGPFLYKIFTVFIEELEIVMFAEAQLHVLLVYPPFIVLAFPEVPTFAATGHPE